MMSPAAPRLGRCSSPSRSASSSRGEDAAAVGGIVRQVAGESALASVASDGAWLSVTVSGNVNGAVGPLIPWTLTAKAWARSESADAPAVSAPATAHAALARRA